MNAPLKPEWGEAGVSNDWCISARQRWLKVRNYMDDKFSNQVNFSNHHLNYYSAWQYTTKEDSSYLESPNHPDLANYWEQTSSQESRSRTRNASEDENEWNEGKRKKTTS